MIPCNQPIAAIIDSLTPEGLTVQSQWIVAAWADDGQPLVVGQSSIVTVEALCEELGHTYASHRVALMVQGPQSPIQVAQVDPRQLRLNGG